MFCSQLDVEQCVPLLNTTRNTQTHVRNAHHGDETSLHQRDRQPPMTPHPHRHPSLPQHPCCYCQRPQRQQTRAQPHRRRPLRRKSHQSSSPEHQPCRQAANRCHRVRWQLRATFSANKTAGRPLGKLGSGNLLGDRSHLHAGLLQTKRFAAAVVHQQHFVAANRLGGDQIHRGQLADAARSQPELVQLVLISGPTSASAAGAHAGNGHLLRAPANAIAKPRPLSISVILVLVHDGHGSKAAHCLFATAIELGSVRTPLPNGVETIWTAPHAVDPAPTRKRAQKMQRLLRLLGFACVHERTHKRTLLSLAQHQGQCAIVQFTLRELR
jgi:hypothetical protein